METEELLKHAYGLWEKIVEKIEEEYSGDAERGRDVMCLLMQRVNEMGNTVWEDEIKRRARLALRVGTKEDLAKAARDKQKQKLAKAALKTTKFLIESTIKNRLLQSSKADLETELSDSGKRAKRLRKERNDAVTEVEELRAHRDRLAEELDAYKDASKAAVEVLKKTQRAKMPRLGTQTGKYEFENVADEKVKEGPWADELTKEHIDKMKVPQLQAALDDRNLDTTGLKATLKKRLLGAIDDGKTN